MQIVEVSSEQLYSQLFPCKLNNQLLVKSFPYSRLASQLDKIPLPPPSALSIKVGCVGQLFNQLTSQLAIQSKINSSWDPSYISARLTSGEAYIHINRSITDGLVPITRKSTLQLITAKKRTVCTQSKPEQCHSYIILLLSQRVSLIYMLL